MEATIRLAYQSEERELRDIFLFYDMDLAGDIEDHMVVKKGEKILAGGMLSLRDRCLFHLEVLAVSNDQRGTGAGRLLLSNLLQSPWLYCHGSVPDKNEIYTVTTISRGNAVPFYERFGFRRSSFPELAGPYQEQCDTCSDHRECQPVPMIFLGGERI